MKKQIGLKLMAGILAAVMMVTSVPWNVYAAEPAGRTEQKNSVSAEDGSNADEEFDSEEKNEEETSGDENTDGSESKTDVPNDEIGNEDANGEEIPDEDNVSGKEDESETPGENDDSEETDAAEDADSLDNTESDDGDRENDTEFGNKTQTNMEEILGIYEKNAVNGFVPRTTNPGNNTFYTSGNPYSGPNNCTYYVWGRAHELLGYKPYTWQGNAGNWWYNNDGYERGSVPRLGAIMCWSGHVAVVEAIGNGTVSFSEASYDPSYAFRYKENISTSTLSNIYRGTFQGYIYLPGVGIENKPERGSEMFGSFTRTIPDGDYHIVTGVDGDMCLTIDRISTENGANADIFHGTEEDFQVWTVTWLGADKGYKIIHRYSGKSLTVDGDGDDKQLNGSNVDQFDWYGSSEQMWVIDEVDQGAYYTIRSKRSGYYLDVEGGAAADKTNVQMYKWVGAGNLAQSWRFIPAGTQTIPDGDYYIMTDVSGNMCLDIQGASTADEANVIISNKTGRKSQVFTVSYLNNGFYKILNKNSGKSLDVYIGAAVRGTNVQQFSDHGGKCQQWTIRESGDGSYYIQPRCSGHYMDVADGKSVDGTNVWTTVWMGGAAAQKWKFEPVLKSKPEKEKLNSPAASIPSGTEVEAGTAVSLLSGTDGAAIYYTLDGTNPSKESFHYSKPFIIEKYTVITAYTVKDGYEDSEPTVFTYMVKSKDDYGKGDVLEEDIPQGKVENIPQGLWMSAVSSQIYTGQAIKPQVRVYDHTTLLTEKKDYTITYKNNIKANIASGVNVPTITVTGKGNYTGKEVQTFVIRPKRLSDVDVMADDFTLQYNGKVQKPLPVVTWNGKKLTRNRDYTVSYPNEESDGVANPTAYIKPGTYTVLVTGMGNYTGEKTIKITITQSTPASAMTVAKIKDHTYTGGEVRPVPVVKSGKAVLTEGEDYEVSYQNNISVGTATVMITGKGSFAGVKKVTFKIVPRASLNKAKAEMEFDSPAVYTGGAVRPDRCRLTVSEKNADGRTVSVTLTEGIDYEVSYQNDNKAGTATVIFKGMNGYSGSLKKTYKIAPYDIGKDAADLAETDQKIRIELADSYMYVKGGCKPEPVVTYQGKVLTKGTDYTLSYKNCNSLNDGSNSKNKSAVIVKGKGCFKGTREKTFRITSKEIGRLTMTAEDRVWQNKGNIYKTKVVIKDENGKVLNAGKDYDSTFTYVYDSDTQLSDGTLRYADDSVMSQDIIPAGAVIRVTAFAKGSNYAGSVSCVYRITKANIGKAVVTIPVQTYTGRAITPESDIRIKLNGQILSEENYRITGYSNNINKGTATVTISGINDCGGTKTAKFMIKGKGLLWWWR